MSLELAAHSSRDQIVPAIISHMVATTTVVAIPAQMYMSNSRKIALCLATDNGFAEAMMTSILCMRGR